MRLIATFLLGVALAAPAGAQIVGRPAPRDVRAPDRLGPAWRLPAPPAGREARSIRRDVERLRDSGAISRQEARSLSRQARAIARQSGALSPASAEAVQAQLAALRSQVVSAPNRRNRR